MSIYLYQQFQNRLIWKFFWTEIILPALKCFTPFNLLHFVVFFARGGFTLPNLRAVTPGGSYPPGETPVKTGTTPPDFVSPGFPTTPSGQRLPPSSLQNELSVRMNHGKCPSHNNKKAQCTFKACAIWESEHYKVN